MVIQVNQQELDLFYRKAKEGYFTCISNPENAYLQAEVTVALPDIAVRQGNVKIVLSPASVDTHQLEVHLLLCTLEKHIGEYVSIMEATGEVIDDNLVFY